jgi:lauroyl/myristoyl acyltransferase
MKFLSTLTLPFYFGRKRVAKRNLKLIPDFTERQVHEVITEGLRNATLTTFIHFYNDRFNEAFFKRYVVLYGEENIKEFYDKKRGAIAAFVHNFDKESNAFLGFVVDYHVLVFVQEVGRTWISKIETKIRWKLWKSSTTLHYHFVQPGSGTSIIRSLINDGKVVGAAVDGVHSRHFISVPFFNKKIRLPGGVFWLATKLQVPIVPIFFGFDREANTFRIWVGNPIQDGDYETRVKEYAVQFEQHLREHPSHWTGWWRMKLVRDETGEEVFHPHTIGYGKTTVTHSKEER